MNRFRTQFIKMLKEQGPLTDLSGGIPAAPGNLPQGDLGIQGPELQASLDDTQAAGDTPDPILDGLPQWQQTAKELQGTTLELLKQVKIAAGKPGAGKIWGRAASLLSDIGSKFAALGSEFESAGVTYSATKAELARQGQ